MLARDRFRTETPNVIDPGEDAPLPPRPNRCRQYSFEDGDSDKANDNDDNNDDDNNNNINSGLTPRRSRRNRHRHRRESDIYMNGNKGTISKGIRISRCILNDDANNHNSSYHSAQKDKISSFDHNDHDNDNDNDDIAHQARVFAAAMISESERRHNSDKNLNIDNSSIITSDRHQQESVSSSLSTSTLRKMMNRASSFRSNNNNVNNVIVENSDIDIERKKKKFQFSNDELDTIYLVDDTNVIDTLSLSSSLSSNNNKYIDFLFRKVICRIGICLTVAIFVVASFAIVATMSQESSSSTSIRGGSSENNSNSNSNSSSNNNVSTALKISNDERLESIVQFLSEKTKISSAKDLYDSTSPQHRAAKWLADDDSERLAVPTTTSKGDFGENSIVTTTTAVASSFNFVQRYALAVIYFAMNGDDGDCDCNDDGNNSGSWINNYHFISDDQHECSWFEIVKPNENSKNDEGGNNNVDGREQQDDDEIEGTSSHSHYYSMGVTCDRDLQVRSIILPSNNLKGNIPSEIQYLSKLDFLDLSHNSIDGTIPREFQNLEQLKYLILKSNQLTGPLIPYWLLGNSGGEKGSGNSVVSELSMTNKRLRFLDLSNNNLIQDVVESHNGSVPFDTHNGGQSHHHFGETSLETLILGGNNCNNNLNDGTIERTTDFIIPEQIRYLTNLRGLSLNNLTLHGTIPSWLGSELRNLKYLLLHDNALTGTVPALVGSLPNLSTLTLHHNNVTMGSETGAFICAAKSKYFSSSYPKTAFMLKSLTTDCGDSSCPCCMEECCRSEDCFQDMDWDNTQNSNSDAYTW